MHLGYFELGGPRNPETPRSAKWVKVLKNLGITTFVGASRTGSSCLWQVVVERVEGSDGSGGVAFLKGEKLCKSEWG